MIMEAKADHVGRVAKKPRTFLNMLGHCPTEKLIICHVSIVTHYEQDVSQKIEETVRMVISNG